MLQSEVRPLRRVLLRHARDAFGSPDEVRRRWRELNYLGEPDFDAACREYDAFAGLLEQLGATIDWMTGDDLGLEHLADWQPHVFVLDHGGNSLTKRVR